MLLLLFLAPLSTATRAAQRLWQSHADPARLREATNSFTAMVRGDAVGPDGALWVIEHTTQGGLLHVTPTSQACAVSARASSLCAPCGE